MFWKKEREIHRAVDQYIAVTEQCLAMLRNIIFGWIGSPLIAGAGCFAAAKILL